MPDIDDFATSRPPDEDEADHDTDAGGDGENEE
jgi:hypothetical protein